MDPIQRIRKGIKESGAVPLWDYGFDETRASKKSIGAWSLLTETEKLCVSRFNPSKTARNQMIKFLLKNFGFSQHILHELSGLSLGQLKRVTPEK